MQQVEVLCRTHSVQAVGSNCSRAEQALLGVYSSDRVGPICYAAQLLLHVLAHHNICPVCARDLGALHTPAVAVTELQHNQCSSSAVLQYTSSWIYPARCSTNVTLYEQCNQSKPWHISKSTQHVCWPTAWCCSALLYTALRMQLPLQSVFAWAQSVLLLLC